MKTVVSVQDLLDHEIRPDALLAEYRRLTEVSIAERWPGGRDCRMVPCPGCSSDDSAPAFQKMGLDYRSCGRCGSLFVSPRPDDAALASYYRDSAAARYWRDRILPATAEARHEKLAEPRALWILDTVAEHAPGAETIIDIGAWSGPVVEVLLQESPGLRVVAAHSGADLDHRRTHERLEVRPGSVGELPPGLGDAVLALDTIDRTSDLDAFLASAHAALRPGGLLFVTASSVSGFDLQVLWEKAAVIMPPDKLNLLSIDGWLARFPAPKWEVVELSTPGMFDVENVRRAVEADPGVSWPRVVRTVIGSDETARRELQAWLQQFRLASFARLVVRRSV